MIPLGTDPMEWGGVGPMHFMGYHRLKASDHASNSDTQLLEGGGPKPQLRRT